MTHRLNSTIRNLVAAAVLIVAAAGCNDGQVVDAGGERGQGGLAFVLLAFFFLLFLASLFYMDRVRQRRSSGEDVNSES